MPVITISRTLGSGGAAIGREVARRLRYRYFDRDELLKVAKERRYLRADLEVLDEKSLSLFDVLFRDRPKEFLSFLHDTICDVAEQDNAVILGRGGQAILRDLSTAFHVRVDAPLEMRVRVVAELFGETEAKARKRIHHVDTERGEFVRQAFGVDWADPLQYHLLINTGLVDSSTAVRILLQAFRQIRWEDRMQQARGVLQRYRLAKTIRESLIKHPEITCPSCVDVRCDDEGVVTLTGRLPEPREKAVIENAVRKVKGVKRIVNKLRP
ncbi:MAG: cytidylate kinase family protein [Thermodesulfobacteriota bacterium]